MQQKMTQILYIFTHNLLSFSFLWYLINLNYTAE